MAADAEELSDGHVDKAGPPFTPRHWRWVTGVALEVGAGVSQLVPVIIAALYGRTGLSLIEQPEIHVHPAIQVGLGDLSIDAVTAADTIDEPS